MNAWLLTCPITPAFCLSSIHFLITLCTCFGSLYHIVVHFSHCHLWFWYPFMFKVLVQEWTHLPSILFEILSQLLLWRLEHIPNRGFPPFPLSHLTLSQYSYHERQLLDINGCCHSLSYLLKHGIMCIIHDNACNDNCYLWKDKIIYGTHTKIQFHSPCYKDLWLFSFLFQFHFYYLCSGHYSLSSKIFLNSLNVYFLLSTMCLSQP
jgi:hypothetical protein